MTTRPATRPTPVRGPSRATLPADPAAFVAAAEQSTNDRDAAAVAAVFALDADSVIVTDGAEERYHGREHIHLAWQALLAGMERRRLHLTKALVTAGDGVIVNTWRGSLNGRTDARGIEVWHFDADGLVREHQLYNYLSVRPSANLVARLKLGLVYPLTGLTLLREQRRVGVRSL
jgi:nuclear transport factor 2 (NTF2) superfamily protein